MAQKQPAALTEGKLNYLSKNDHIISKKQVAHDAKNEEIAIADTFQQTSYGLNFITTGRLIETLDPFTRDHLIGHQYGFLRDGYVNRVHGLIYPIQTPKLPAEPFQPITPKTFPRAKLFDDHTGKNMFELTAGEDFEFARYAIAYIDPDKYLEFVNTFGTRAGTALGMALKLCSSVYAMASYPTFTLSSDIHLVPFLDQTLKPDENTSPGAAQGFDVTKNNFGKDCCVKEIAGQVQQKLTNVMYYSVRRWAYDTSELKIAKPVKPTIPTAEAQIKKIFFEKGNGDELKMKEYVTPFTSALALVNAIRETLLQMTTLNVPQNMGCYKPFETGAQTATQIARTADPNDLEVILNPYDYELINRSISNTSPEGNYTVTLNDWKAKGVKFYIKDTVLPGHAIVQEKYTYYALKVYENMYTQPFNFCNAQQSGAHMFIKIFISGLTCYRKLVPLEYCPANEYVFTNFNSLKPA